MFLALSHQPICRDRRGPCSPRLKLTLRPPDTCTPFAATVLEYLEISVSCQGDGDMICHMIYADRVIQLAVRRSLYSYASLKFQVRCPDLSYPRLHHISLGIRLARLPQSIDAPFPRLFELHCRMSFIRDIHLYVDRLS